MKIDTPLIHTPVEGSQYKIQQVAEKTVKGYKGIEVIMRSTEDGDTDVYTVMLWSGENATSTSKLGSFLDALGSDTDKWIGKVITLVSWQPKDREIEVEG